MLRFYYVNVYRTICFLSASLSSGDDDELLMEFFFSTIRLFPSSHFPLSNCCCCWRAVEVCLRWIKSEKWKSLRLISITMLQVMTSRCLMELLLGCGRAGRWCEKVQSDGMSIQLFSLAILSTSAWASRNSTYLCYTFCVVCANVSGRISRKSSTVEKCRSQAEKQGIASRALLNVFLLLFSGPSCVWKWKLTGRIISACARQQFLLPFASFKADPFFWMFLLCSCIPWVNEMSGKFILWIMKRMWSRSDVCDEITNNALFLWRCQQNSRVKTRRNIFLIVFDGK